MTAAPCSRPDPADDDLPLWALAEGHVPAAPAHDPDAFARRMAADFAPTGGGEVRYGSGRVKI